MYSSEYEDEQVSNDSSKSFYQNNKKLVWIFIAIVLVVIGLIIFSKKSDNKSTDNDNNYSITIFPKDDVTVSPGSSYKLAAVVNNNPDATIIWTSSDDSVAKVDNGSVTGIKYGTVTITAAYVHSDNQRYEDTKNVIVAEGKKDVQITDILIKNGDLILPINGKYNISFDVVPSNGFISSKEFVSSDTNVVTVNESGYVEAINEGEATITLNVNNGAFVRNLKVFVNRDYTNSEIVVNPDKITLSKEISKLKKGASAKISYTVTPTEAKETVLTWTSSDESVLTVDRNGIISALKEGKATIKATASNGISDAVEIEVDPNSVAVTDIELSMTEVYLEAGQNQTITPVIIPDNVTDKTLMCTSSDMGIVSVTLSEDGTSCIVNALSSGTATVTIQANNSEVFKEINVIVTDSTPIDPGTDGGSGGGGSSCKKNCPNGQYLSNCKCVTCEANNYCVGSVKKECNEGYTSKAGASSCTRSSCPAGSYLDPSHSTGCRPCPSGQVCPGGTAMPSKCGQRSKPNPAQTACVCENIEYCATYTSTCLCKKCRSGYTSYNSGYTCTSTAISRPCSSIGTSSTCIANGCTWSYDKGCH